MNVLRFMTEDFNNQADDLIKAFRSTVQARNPRDCLCILIDPLLSNPLSELDSIKDVPARTLGFRHDDLAIEDTPYLLQVGREQDHERLVSDTLRLALAEQKAALLESPASRSVCAWLFVDKDDLFKLADALSRLALIAQPGSHGKRKLFRFWDPRVFQHLSRILGKQTLEGALPDRLTVQWLWLEPSGQLSSHIFSNGHGWRPSPTEWASLVRIEDLNQCLFLSETQERVDSSNHIVALDHSLQRATELGCSEAADRITYALLSMSLGGYFEDHPLMTDLFRRVARDQASLAALAEEVDQGVWDQIKNDMAQAHAHQKSGISTQ